MIRILLLSLLLSYASMVNGQRSMFNGQSSTVNPWIGVGGHGHVFLGANVPFGFVQLGPTQHTRGW
ncbi:MAG: hypothetical protein II390_07995, partial [Prevotella sp.]|nr:hypothetical protein [Prevotella sp.]